MLQFKKQCKQGGEKMITQETHYPLPLKTEPFPNRDDLPIYLNRNYNIELAEYAGVIFLLAKPLDKINLSAIRKQRLQLETITGLKCVLVFDTLNWYTREKMLEEGIPFILKDRQLFLPFLGVLLSQDKQRDLKKAEKLSFATQHFLLMAIYQRWTNMTVTAAAKEMSVSKMTMTRCYDEIESIDPSLIKKSGRTRRFVWDYSTYDLWKLLNPFFRNPVIRTYSLRDPMEITPKKLSGLSAIAHYTMISDNAFGTLAISLEEEKLLSMKKRVCVPDNEIPAMVVQVTPYKIDYADGKACDPLTAILSLSEEEDDDPRIESAIDELLKEVFHDNGNTDF